MYIHRVKMFFLCLVRMETLGIEGVVNYVKQQISKLFVLYNRTYLRLRRLQ